MIYKILVKQFVKNKKKTSLMIEILGCLTVAVILIFHYLMSVFVLQN